MPVWLANLAKVLGIVAVSYALLVAFLYFTQHRMLYYPNVPSRELEATPESTGFTYEDVSIRTADGVELHGWWLPAVGERVLLFFHGNAGNISHRIESLRQFNRLGFSVLIIDYRGYGLSEGRPSETGTYRDAEAAWRHLTETRGLAAENIVVFGRSLGASVAAWLAARQTPAALIVEAGFVSVPALAQEIYGYLPARWLSRFEYSTERHVAAVQCPVLVVHSRDDDIVPFRHAQQIFASAGEPKMLLELQGAHNDAHISNEQFYLLGIEQFLRQHVDRRP